MTVEKDGNIARLDVRDVHAWPHGLRTAFWREGVARWNPARGYFREEHWEAIDRAALTPEKPERIRLPGGIEVRREAGELVFRTECFEKCMNQEDFERILPVPGRLSLPEGELECFRLKAGLDPDFSNYFNIFLPENRIPGPLSVRFRKRGDRIHLPNLGSRRISRVLSDMKIPRIRRERIPFLVVENEVIWIVGLRRSSRYYLSENDAPVLGIKYTVGQSK